MDTKKKKPTALFAAPLPRTGSTIFHTHVERLNLLNELDSSKKIKRVLTGDVAMLAGPKGEDLIPEEYSQAFAQVMSLYPLNVKVGTREGDPICDSYRIHTSDTGSLWCLTDGCNWGPRPFQAANRCVLLAFYQALTCPLPYHITLLLCVYLFLRIISRL